jgi:hypothetical protein
MARQKETVPLPSSRQLDALAPALAQARITLRHTARGLDSVLVMDPELNIDVRMLCATMRADVEKALVMLEASRG